MASLTSRSTARYSSAKPASSPGAADALFAIAGMAVSPFVQVAERTKPKLPWPIGSSRVSEGRRVANVASILAAGDPASAQSTVTHRPRLRIGLHVVDAITRF